MQLIPRCRSVLLLLIFGVLVAACAGELTEVADAPEVEVAGTAVEAADTAASSTTTVAEEQIQSEAPTLSLDEAIAAITVEPWVIPETTTSTTTTTTAAPTTTTAAPTTTTIAPASTTTTSTPVTTTATPTTVAPTTTTTTVTPAPPAARGSFPASPLAQVGVNNPGVLLGISTGLSTREREPRFNFLEQSADREFDIGHVFHSWGQAIPRVDDLIHLNEGRILMISWNGTDTIQIQNGVHDDWIRQQATAVRDLEQPVMLRWLWEMDGNRRIGTVHSGPDFVAAWNHVRGIFNEVGADNAEFVWCPNTFLFWNGGDPSPWYPGDDNVDWLCADGYNWGSSTTSADWMSFTEIFEDFHAWAAPRGLPIVIAETGSNEADNDPNARAEWLRDVPNSLRNDLPAIDAVIYFDKDFRFQGHPDWRLDTTPQAFEAWNDIAVDPYLNPNNR